MAGREKQMCYEYDEKGKYLQSYSSMSEVRTKYYKSDIGKRPLFEVSNVYHKTPNNTFITKERIGRNGLLKQLKIDNCPYCTNNSKEFKPFGAFNLKGELIAEFNNIHNASLLINMSKTTLFHRLNDKKIKTRQNLGQKLGNHYDLVQFKYI